MPVTAPDSPSSAELERRYGVEFYVEHADRVAAQRLVVGSIIDGKLDQFIGIIGPCAMTDTAQIDTEGDALLAVTQSQSGLLALHRMPPWKPRTKAEDWHGLETTDPEAAYQIILRRAIAAANVSLEFGQPYHPERYGRHATFGWIGSRNVNQSLLIRHVALHPATRHMPLGIKNGLDGHVTTALEQVTMVNELRGGDGAPAVLIYRGGEEANTPDAWERLYLQALEQSGGVMLVDMAHGAEMAHHPDGNFNKSVEGQERAQAHYLYLDAAGFGALGLMHEASSAKSPVDPPIEFMTAVNGVRQAAASRSGRLVVAGRI